jgi:hypothetical protein
MGLRFGKGPGFGGNVLAAGGASSEATPRIGGRDVRRSEDPVAMLCTGDHFLETDGLSWHNIEPEGERGEEALDG